METVKTTSNQLVAFSYTLLLKAIIAGVIALCFEVRLGLLASAILFGWSQIGGL